MQTALKRHRSRSSRTLVKSVLLAALLLSAVQDAAAAPRLRIPGLSSGNPEICAAERAPLIERKRQYDRLRRTRIAKAAAEGVKKGFLVFTGLVMRRIGLDGRQAGEGKDAADNADARGGLRELIDLPIPGVTTSANGRSDSGLSSDLKAYAAVSVAVAIVGTVEAYVRLKQEEADGDRYKMARSIDEDARLQISVSRAIAAEQALLSECLSRQVTDLSSHLASASNREDRNKAEQRRSSLTKTIQSDIDLTGGLVGHQVTLTKAFTQGRAMTEGVSEKDVLGTQQPAYAETAGVEKLALPSAEEDGVRSPPQLTYVTLRATVARAEPNPKARALTKLAKGQKLESQEATRGSWAPILLSGDTGYVRLADLSQVAGPKFAPAINIRQHNGAVIQARSQGPERLKTLLTGIQGA